MEGLWVDHRGSRYVVKYKQGVGLEVVRDNGQGVRTYRMEWDGQTFAWPSHSTNHLAVCVNADVINWRCACTGRISFTWSLGTDSTNRGKKASGALLTLPSCSSQQISHDSVSKKSKVGAIIHRHPSEPVGTFTSPKQEQGLSKHLSHCKLQLEGLC